jgi:S-DNA-T family DNA segregation ATPase FtsK/SpoIIIE
LADVDPGLVGDRVWTQPLHIADRLASIARSCEDIIQQSLRDKHRNLYDYNLTAGPMALPYRMIVWDQFPFGLDDNSWQSLCSILAAGGRCGVGVILRLSKSHVWPSFADPKKLEEFGLHLDFDIVEGEERVSWRLDEVRHAPVHLVPPPNDAQIRTIMRHQLDHVSQLGRLIVPFDSIAVPGEERQVTSSADSLAIPIGVAASGRTQLMKLGVGTAQHVLIAGKTGSGKSSLLHTMITSAALKYSPEELRLVLLDFKKGVEFQVYSEAKVPHADIIGIESKREFGVSTLEYIDRIMHARGEAFRSRGVQDIPSLEKKCPEVLMPRILIVIDEFQELFVEDDKISQQAAMLMDRIVRQGRSFGIHLVLASQTLGGAYSLPRTTLAQMAVRIALQCDSSDAMLILGEDNTAAERLRFSGQAIYNEAGGRIESNQGFQVAYIDKETQLRFLHQIPSASIPNDATTNPMGRCIVFEGHKPAVWDDQTLNRSLLQNSKKEEGCFPMILGDSVSIDPPIIRWIQRNAGRNIAVVGPDESVAASILAGTIQGIQWLARSPSTAPSQSAYDALKSETANVFVLNGARAEDVSLSAVVNRCAGLDGIWVITPRDVQPFFVECKKELDRRLQSSDTKHPVQLVCIPNIARFRELRKGDEFTFGGSDSSPLPDAILSELLKDGPAVGMHVWLWADSVSTLGRWLSRQSMRDLELRVVMQMSANDSNQLIDSNVANKLEPHVAIVQDEMDGKPIKFRPFACQTLPAFR